MHRGRGLYRREGSNDDRREASEVHPFEVATAQRFPGADDGLVRLLDCLHMGESVAAARQARAALKQGETVLLVERHPGDALEGNLNPVGRLFYATLTCIRTPHSPLQDVGLAPGAQAGEKRLRHGFMEARFSRSAARPRRRSASCSKLASSRASRRVAAEPGALRRRPGSARPSGVVASAKVKRGPLAGSLSTSTPAPCSATMDGSPTQHWRATRRQDSA